MQGNATSIAAAYSLSERQNDLLNALMQTGRIGDAAAVLQLPYAAARNTVAELKKKLGVSTIPMMIGLAVELTADDTDRVGQARTQAPAHDLFSLSDRQYSIARAMSVAKSRSEIASSLNLSESVLSAELKNIYLILGVRSAGELISVVAAALPGTPPATRPDVGHSLPADLIVSNGRTIGYSDFGPPGARPVLILHSTITSRAPPTRLLLALQEGGYRPLVIDRPGFGGTDPGGIATDPYLLAAHDAAAVCQALGLSEIDLVARGSGQAAMRLAKAHPTLVRRAILVNPTPRVAFTTVDRGPLGAVKRAFQKRPWAIEAMIRLLAVYVTPGRMYDGMLRSFRESPPDYELVRNDPQFAADYLRATRGFAEGHIAGYVAEQAAWGAGYDVDCLPGMSKWRIVQGRHFILHDPTQAMKYWQMKLPDTPIRWIDAAGQMLAYSHPHEVVAALDA